MAQQQRKKQGLFVQSSEPEPSSDQPPVVNGIRKIAYLAMAFLFLGLGMIGVALPGIPTTPFLLLMSFFLIRASPRLHQKVLAWPIVGRPLRDWQTHRGVRTRVKITAYIMVAIMVGLSIAFSPFGWPLRCAVLVAAAVGVFIVFRLPTIENDQR